jgi:polysaccharide biosynthesis protein PslG
MLLRLLPLLVLSACTPDWEPPGGGVAKGCDGEWSYGVPLDRGLGLSTHLSWATDEAATASREFELSQWPGLGVQTARRDLHWSAIEPEQGSFDFTGPDLLIDAVDGAGAELLGLLVYGNDWACSDCGDGNYPPDDPADYATYAAALVERYQDRVQRWEIWNEPNGGIRFWEPVEDPVAYAELALLAAQAIHAVDPGAEVSLGGLFWPDLLFATPGPEFLDAVLEAQPTLVDELDAVAWHPYRYPFSAPEHSDDYQASLLEEGCALREQLAAHGGERLDAWITELGWHTAPDALYEGVSEEEQAAYLVRSTVLAWAQGSSMYLWYTFLDGGDSDSDQEQRFGLYSHDGEPKAAATAMGVLGRAVVGGGYGSISDRSVPLGLDEQGYAYRLEGEEAELWILWTTELERELTLPAWTDATVMDLEGGERTVEPDRGAITVEIGPAPVFVTLPLEPPGPK